MATTLIVVALATFFALRSWMVQQIDASLMQPKVRLFADEGDGGRVGEAVRSWVSSGATVVVLGSTGQGIPIGEDFPGAPARDNWSPADSALLRSVPTSAAAEPVTIDVSPLGKSQAVSVPAVDANGRPVSLVALIQLSRAGQLAGRLLTVELVAVSLALLLALMVSMWFIRRSLRPLQEVAETASEVARLPLGRGDVTIPARVANPVPTTEVGQVGLAVNAMLDHVEASLQTRVETEDRLRQFVSDAGHELRTPLAAVRGYSELMRRGIGTDPESTRESAARIEAAASRMGLLVDDLLLLASLDEERPLAQDPIDLHTVVDDAVAEAATAGPDHQWKVEVATSEDVLVVGDSVRLHQAVGNLLANARNHTMPGSTVTITVSSDDGNAVVEVRDDGPGFPTALLPRVTERFARGDASRSRATGGSGLGLSITKAIVEAHDGTLAVANGASGTGVGAVVRISIPLLVVDDDEFDDDEFSDDSVDGDSFDSDIDADVDGDSVDGVDGDVLAAADLNEATTSDAASPSALATGDSRAPIS